MTVPRVALMGFTAGHGCCLLAGRPCHPVRLFNHQPTPLIPTPKAKRQMMLTSILRTVVPALWGSLIGWLLGVVPMLEPLRGELLTYGNLAVPVIAAILIGAWYAFWRWLEPKLPDWLTRILLGSAQTPHYDGKHEAGAAVINMTINASGDPQSVSREVAKRISRLDI